MDTLPLNQKITGYPSPVAPVSPLFFSHFRPLSRLLQTIDPALVTRIAEIVTLLSQLEDLTEVTWLIMSILRPAQNLPISATSLPLCHTLPPQPIDTLSLTDLQPPACEAGYRDTLTQ